MRASPAPIEPIAIVGIGCRFPGGVTDPASFWRLLCDGASAITETPKSRFDLDRFYDDRPATPGRVMTRWGGWLDHLEELDAAFFGMSPREAERLDPGQRLLLETAWEAFEDAGQDMARLEGSNTGVFIGQWLSDFESRLFHDPERVDFYMTTGSGRYASSGRLSYVFGLQGPSLTLDTACSSSLAAVHLACQSLRAGECEVAIAGGANVILQPHISIAYSQSLMMAPDGHCKFGDADADGYVRSEGAGIVVLKPLSHAVRDGDRTYAMIRGSAVNNDGHGSGSLGTPSRAGQAALLRKAYGDARMPPATVGYVEAHGTGTRTGDPVELGALGDVLAEGRAAGHAAQVGSVKTNIGHTEGAAGIAGLIKAALAVRHGMIPASLHCHIPNPAVPWEELSLEVPRTALEWPAHHASRVAGVSAFGIAGTNAHVVIEQAPAPDATVRARPVTENTAQLLLLSARSPEALAALARAYADLLQAPGAPSIGDVCASAALHRTALEYRAAFADKTREGFADRLRRFASGEGEAAHAHGRRPEAQTHQVAFIFPGQGSQWVGMVRELLEREPAFRASLERAEAAMPREADWSLLAQLRTDEGDPAFRLNDISVIQPVLLAVEMALAEWWRAHGVEPDAIVGHSLGEIGAAFIAGTLTLEQAMSIACARSALMRRTSGKGAMAVAELSMDQAAARIAAFGGRLSVAVESGPRSTVISGEPGAIASLLQALERDGVFCRQIKVDVASHSAQMDPLAPELVATQKDLRPRAATTALYSTVRASRVGGTELDAEYWGRNLRAPVLFGETVGAMLADGVDTFIEMSPHPTLLGSVREIGQARGLEPLALQSLRRQEPERIALLATLGALFVAGRNVDWRRVFADDYARVDLPRYPWQRERYWLDLSEPRPARRNRHDGLPGTHTASSTAADTHFWDAEIGVAVQPYLAEHIVNGVVVVPAATFVEMALEAAAQIDDASGGALSAVTIENALVLSGAARAIQTVLEPGLVGTFAFTISSRSVTATGANDGEWTTHARGLVHRATRAEPPSDWSAAPANARPTADDAHYEAMRARGLDYGPAFRGVHDLRVVPGQAWARIALPASAPRSGHRMHPAALDACLQLGLAVLPEGTAGDTYVPSAIEHVRWGGTAGVHTTLLARASVADGARASDGGYRVDVSVFAGDGTPLVELTGLTFVRLTTQAYRQDRDLFEVTWEPQPPAVVPSRKQDAERASQPAGWSILADGHGIGPALVARFGDAVRLWDGTESGKRGDNSPTDSVVQSCLAAVRLVQTASARTGAPTPRLFIVTAGAQSVVESDVPAVAQAPLWGLGRVIANEHPELRCTLIDLSPTAADGTTSATDDTGDMGLLVRELDANGDDDQVAFRGGVRYVPRLVAAGAGRARHRRATPTPAAGRSFRVDIDTPGILDELTLHPAERETPERGEVEIEVDATGLNFMNVMSALGIYPGYPNGVGPLGIECAGRVTAIGPDAGDFRVGDGVLAIAFDSLRTHAIADARLVRRIPDGMSPTDAAAFPIAFVTAHYALNDLARMQRGERVLIHAAAGGVGLAAVQLALHAGAEVFATAGTDEKRALLASLGVTHVMDSRSLDFRDDVMARTNGEGVDIVLNSLAGDFIGASLATLRSHGRFVELGKRDIHRNSRIGLLPFQRNLSYFAVDLDRMVRERPAHVSRLLDEVMQLLAERAIRALPVRTFPISRVAEAFRFMAQAGHVGKVAILPRDPDAMVQARATSLDAVIGRTCVITGGLGALGVAVAGRFVERGARSIALVGRHDPDAAAQKAIDAMRHAGADIRVFHADVASRSELSGVLSEIDATMRPMSAVIHAAGVLDDAIVTRLTEAQLARVLAPKVDGAWNLQQLLTARPEVELILFSSVTSLLGLTGQGNYAAANAFLDAMASYRRAHGGGAITINWGPWSGIGLAAASANRGGRLAGDGVGSFAPRDALDALERALDLGPAQIAVMRLDWPAYLDAHPVATRSSLLRPFRDVGAAAAAPATRSIRDALLAVDAGPRRRSAMEAFLKEQVGRVLRQASSRIDASTPFRSLGLDSLMGLELRNRLEAELAVPLSATTVWNYPTVKALAPHLATLVDIPLDAPADDKGDGPAPDDFEALLAEVERLSAEDARALLERDDIAGPAT